MKIYTFKTHHWAYEVEPGLIMQVDYEEDCTEEDVTITIKDRTIKLWADEVGPLEQILRSVALTHQGYLNMSKK